MPPVKAIRWDNYILHMKSVFPHWFMKEVYVCHDFVSGENCSVTKLSHTIAIMILITDGKNIQLIQSISIVMI